jgi:hypothetical protein
MNLQLSQLVSAFRSGTRFEYARASTTQTESRTQSPERSGAKPTF